MGIKGIVCVIVFVAESVAYQWKTPVSVSCWNDGTGELTMAEYIDREALVEKIKGKAFNLSLVRSLYPDQSARALYGIAEDIEKIPTADVVEVRHGEWEQGDYYDVGDVCSLCDYDSQIENCTDNYCPNCGAKMDGKGEGE